MTAGVTKIPQNITSVLIIQLAGLGDMVLATPAMHALRQLYPGASISLLANSRSVEIISGCSDIDEVFVLRGIKNLFKTTGFLRGKHYDIVINLARLYSFSGVVKMFVLFWLIHGKYWVGRNTDQKGFFYHLKVPERLNEQKHEVDSKLYIIRALGAEVKEIKFSLNFNSDEEQFVDKFLENKGMNQGQRLLAINFSTFRPSRNWPNQYYAQLANQLHQETKAKVIFLGVAKDKNAFAQLKKQLNFTPLDFIGVFTARQLGVFLKKCDLLISPDSGVVHIANALGVPMVVLFGPGEYGRYRPYSKINTIIINKNAECAPCFKLRCKNKKCMQSIRPEEVLAAAKQLLTKT